MVIIVSGKVTAVEFSIMGCDEIFVTGLTAYAGEPVFMLCVFTYVEFIASAWCRALRLADNPIRAINNTNFVAISIFSSFILLIFL